MRKTAKKGGAPEKVPGGLKKVLFVRAPSELIDALDVLAEREREHNPGRSISRADMARELLAEALKQRGKRGAK